MQEREGVRRDTAASSVLCTRFGERGGGTHAAWASTAFPGLQDFAKASGIQFGSVLGAEAKTPGRLGWARVSVPGTSVASLCVRPRVDCLIAPAAR